MKILTDESKIRARVFDVIRRIIDIPPVTGSLAREARRDWLAPPDISTFKNIDPIMLYGSDDDWFFHPIDCTPLVEWPIDVCTAHVGGYNGFGFSVQRFRSVTPKQVRGHVHRISPFMLRRDLAIEDNGKMLTASGVLSYLGGKWCGADKRTHWEGPRYSEIPTKGWAVDKYELESGGIAIAIALRHRYEWAVNIGFEKSPSVRILTDPTGMKELFRLRDVADGRDRRDALMTWVSDHWRQDRKDIDIETYVRKHLRGSTKFEWRGMECEISPARFDVEQRDKLIAERNAMKVAGEDKRKAAP